MQYSLRLSLLVATGTLRRRRTTGNDCFRCNALLWSFGSCFARVVSEARLVFEKKAEQGCASTTELLSGPRLDEPIEAEHWIFGDVDLDLLINVLFMQAVVCKTYEKEAVFFLGERLGFCLVVWKLYLLQRRAVRANLLAEESVGKVLLGQFGFSLLDSVHSALRVCV